MEHLGEPANASIAIFRANGEIEHTYVCWDGMPGSLGAVLFDYYNNEDSAEELIALGDMSRVSRLMVKPPDVRHSWKKPYPDVSVAYHRDGNDPWEEVKPQRSTTIRTWASQRADMGCSHFYIWRSGAWWYTPRHDQEPEPLMEVLRRLTDQAHAAKTEGDATPPDETVDL